MYFPAGPMKNSTRRQILHQSRPLDLVQEAALVLLPGRPAMVTLRDRSMTALQQRGTTSWNYRQKSKMQRDPLPGPGKICLADSAEAPLVSTTESQTESPKAQREYHSCAEVRWLPGADLAGEQQSSLQLLEERLVE